jgi:hypothetical protein
MNAPPESSASVQNTDVSSADGKPYMNPYLAGFGLGLVLLASFVLMGRGLGSSGAFSSLVSTVVGAVAPEHAAANDFYARYLGDGSTHPLKDWLVFEVIGVFTGAILSGALANRLTVKIEKGPRISRRSRLVLAFVGGGIMAAGAKLALGCTSGQALTGGAQLNLGSWAFMMMVFGGAYAFAWFLRKEWL